MKIVFCAFSKHNFYFKQHISCFVINNGHVPINPFMLFDYFLSDAVKRDSIRSANNTLVEKSDELWVFGIISDGVLSEIRLARKHNKPIRFFDIVNSDHITEIQPSEVLFEDKVISHKDLLKEFVNI